MYIYRPEEEKEDARRAFWDPVADELDKILSK